MIGKKIWIWIAVAAVAAAAAAFAFGGKHGKDEVKYRSVKVDRGDLDVNILATGTVEPQNRLELKPAIAGRIEEILVREGQEVRKGEIVAWMSSTERAALLDAARIKGPDEIARWAGLYKPAPLVAPIAGTVIARAFEPGQTVSTADAVLVLSDRLIVKAQVDETDIGLVRAGQSALIVLDAYPGEWVEAVVDHIAYEAQTVNNVTMYYVDVLPSAVPDFMRSGMTANVTFRVASKTNVILVPAESVREMDGRRVVLRPAQGRGRRPSPQEVQTGMTDGKKTEILSGIEEGEEILVAEALMPDGNRPASPSNPFSPFGSGRRGSR